MWYGAKQCASASETTCIWTAAESTPGPPSPVPLAGVGLPDENAERFRALGGRPGPPRAVRRQLSASLPEGELDRLVVVGTRVPADVVTCWNEGHPRGGEASLYRGPVLVGRGAEDGMVTTGILPRFGWPESCAVRGAGHWAHVEAPVAVADRVKALLATFSGHGAEHRRVTRRARVPER